LENVQVDADAMQLIARTAQGSMRDAVGLLDQLVPLAMSQTGGTPPRETSGKQSSPDAPPLPISLESARSLLGIADPRLLDSLLDDVLAGRAAEALAEVNRVYAAGAELRQVVRGLMESCRDRLVAALTKRDQPTARRLSNVLDALLHLDGEVRRHAEPRFLVEATLARLAVELGTDEIVTSPQAVNQRVTSPPSGEAARSVGGDAKPGDGDAQPLQAASSTNQRVTSPPSGEAARSVGGDAKPGDGEAPPAQAMEDTSPPAQTAGSIAGWSDVLEKLNRTVRAAYLDAQPEIVESTLVLWFRYGFHHKKAQEQSMQLMPHVRAWLGDDVKVDFRLRDGEAAKSTPRANSPEDDPFVREVVRRFDGRVTRVREVSE
jgi:DNA polymerase-3 subunit gamma/tau